MMTIKKISPRELQVDPIPNSLKQHHKNYMANSNEDYYKWDLGSERVNKEELCW